LHGAQPQGARGGPRTKLTRCPYVYYTLPLYRFIREIQWYNFYDIYFIDQNDDHTFLLKK
jgi:hypothetical protein